MCNVFNDNDENLALLAQSYMSWSYFKCDILANYFH